jgi:hypothetical protein
MGRNAKDLTGQKFGKLTVIRRKENRGYGYVEWTCRCDCGRQHTARTGNLVKGNTMSCGCARTVGAPKLVDQGSQVVEEKPFVQVRAIKELAIKFGGTPSNDFTQSAEQNNKKFKRELSDREKGLKQAREYAARRCLG